MATWWARLSPAKTTPRLVALGLPNGSSHVFDLKAEEKEFSEVAQALRQVVVVGHDLKPFLVYLRQYPGIEPAVVFDTAIATQLLDGGVHRTDRDYFCFDRVWAVANGQSLAVMRDRSVDGVGLLTEDTRRSAAQEAVMTLQLARATQAYLVQNGFQEVADLEMRLVPILAELEATGVAVDRARWERVTGMWDTEAALLEKSVMSGLGLRNLSNHSEVLLALCRHGVLADKTNAEALAPYMHLPIVQNLVRYRRLKSFVESSGKAVLDALNVSRDGRVHPHINEIGATTGRMSADHPNMMGLPRDPMVRSCIVASKGNKLVVGDYHAIELRVAAHLTDDPVLKGLFQMGRDPHRYMASILAGNPEQQVTPEQRARAKPISFGLLLGMGAGTLVTYAKKNFGVDYTLQEAERFKQAFLQSYPGIARWQHEIGTTMPPMLRNASGRTCWSFDPDDDYNARLAFPVQGTAADGLKRAMVLLAPHLRPIGAKIILAVHDAVVEVPDEHAEAAKRLVREGMVAGMSYYVPSVPILVTPEVRSTWGQ